MSTLGRERTEALMRAIAQDKAVANSAGLISTCASEIEPEPVEWLWEGRLARGKHTCIAGEPGTGKSQLTTAIAATITMGGQWPCGEGKAPQGSVIILSAEDDAADTIVPRLHAAGADLGRVHIVSAVRTVEGGRRSFNLKADLELLERKIEALRDVMLVCIDPISSYMGGTDSHKNAEVRGILEPIGEMAARMRVAILSITHFSKSVTGNTTKALHRFIGSIAFVGAPRTAFAVIEDPEDKDRRLMLHAKNNLAPPPPGLAFTPKQTIVAEGIVASCIEWELEHVSVTADAALAAPEGNDQRRPALTEAMEFLLKVLGKGGQCAKEVQRQAVEAGISSKTLRRAREKLGVKIRTEGFQGPSVWELPSQCCPSTPNIAHQNNVGKIGRDGQDWTVESSEPPSDPADPDGEDWPSDDGATVMGVNGLPGEFDNDYPELPACLDRRK